MRVAEIGHDWSVPIFQILVLGLQVPIWDTALARSGWREPRQRACVQPVGDVG